MAHRRTLADGVEAVVTTCTAYGYTGVIEHASCELSGVMTHAAILGGGDVRGMLAGGECTIMTRSTVARDAIVSEY